ncbi:rho GTPase-activating protein 19 isoform X2 [Strongylocentrotus purpuratus]|uniref:Rho-GAP domain-containing protein n=1 Tax=Strongylocentrotus purpuratus TaxID=7668 RepID=A0A7M7NVZ4_STRPU|nr:rho GTPase-activating protein 19 isoform X2 [Strongylocentrotus purpuratus]
MSGREVLCNPLYYVEVMRLKYTETLTDWCCIELSHVLDFSGTDGLGQVLMGKVDNRQGKTIIRKFTRHKKKAAALQPQLSVFGAPLNEEGYCKARQLIDYLKDYVHVEGLFRIPGNSSRQSRLKDLLSMGRTVDLESSEFTPHDAACVLKTFLSELPEPLLTDKHYEAHIQAAELTYKLEILPHQTPEMLGRLRATRTTSQVGALRYLFLMLQPCTYKLLRDVMELLHTVAANEETNKMNASSLGILFAPHVLWPRFLTTNDLRDQSYINKLNYAVEFMISYTTSIFKVPDSMLQKCALFVKNGGKLPEDEEEKINHRQRAQSDDELECVRRLPISQPETGSVTTHSTQDFTQNALAQLYADVQSMPESSKKRKLMKQKQLSTPFSSRKKRLAPNPPPQKFLPTSHSVEEPGYENDLVNGLNDLNSCSGRTSGSPFRLSMRKKKDLNIPSPAPRTTPHTPGSHRRNDTPGARPVSQRTKQPLPTSQEPRPTKQTSSSSRRPVLKPHSTDNITPTRKAPSAPPKKYSPYIPPPRSHSSPIEMDYEAPTENSTKRGLPRPRSQSSPKEMLRGTSSRQSQSRRTPVPAPRTNTPPVSTTKQRKRRSDGTAVDSPLVVGSHHAASHRPVPKPRIVDKRQLQTAV